MKKLLVAAGVFVLLGCMGMGGCLFMASRMAQ